jgi:hypothetical protein
MFFSITNAFIASKSVTEIATLVAMAAVPAFQSHKRISQMGFEPFSMQKHVLFRLILIVKYSSVVCLFGCASLYRTAAKNNCFWT